MLTGNLGKQGKSLLILDLNGLLGYMTKSYTHHGVGVYNTGYNEAKPIYTEGKTAIFARPSLEKVTFETLVRKKSLYDVGVWSSAGFEDTKLMVDKFFGRNFTQLLFVTYDMANQSGDCKPRSMERNYTKIWQKYTQYNESNTIMISNFYNKIEDFQRNDLVLPEFSPTGTTDLLADMHLQWMPKYLHMIAAIEGKHTADMRQQMEVISYKDFLKRSTKSLDPDRAKFGFYEGN